MFPHKQSHAAQGRTESGLSNVEAEIVSRALQKANSKPVRVRSPTDPATRVRNDLFNARDGLDRGRRKLVEAIWYLTKCAFFLSALPWPSPFKCVILRLFGARVGRDVYIKPRVNIHFPWKLHIGDHSWIGEEVFLLNFEPITIGAHCCISQRAFLCTGNHNYRRINMPYRNRPITVRDGAWVGAQVFVGPGVTIGSEAVLAAGSVAIQDQPAGMVSAGNPCQPIRSRWNKNNS